MLVAVMGCSCCSRQESDGCSNVPSNGPRTSRALGVDSLSTRRCSTGFSPDGPGVPRATDSPEEEEAFEPPVPPNCFETFLSDPRLFARAAPWRGDQEVGPLF